MAKIPLEKIQVASIKRNKKRLSTKEALFVQGITNDQEPKKVAREVYNVGGKHNKGKVVSEKVLDHNALVIANENLNRPSIVQTVNELMDDRGLTKQFLIDSLKTDIELKVGNRAREIEIAGKWQGLDKPTQHMNINMNMSEEQSERLLGLV